MSQVTTNGICYWRPSYDEPDPPKGFFRHHYKWRNKAAGNTGFTNIWTESPGYPQALLSAWNSSGAREYSYEKATKEDEMQDIVRPPFGGV